MVALHIAWRNLHGPKQERFISIVAWTSVLGIAIGVAALIIVISVMKGFESELRERILGTSSHLLIHHGSGAIPDPEQLRRDLLAREGIRSADAVRYSNLMLVGSRNLSGIMVKGLQGGNADYLAPYLREGSLADLQQENSIILGYRLARKYNLFPGDTLTVLAPSGRLSPFGSIPRRQRLKLVGVLETGMYEYDSSLGLASLQTIAGLEGTSRATANAMEVRVEDIFATGSLARTLEDDLGEMYRIQDWSELNSNLFSAMKLERVSMFLILCVIVIVASFNIISTLIMMVMEKTRDIGILLSIGATQGFIRRVFLLQGLLLGVTGTLVGVILGILLCWALQKYQFVQLPADVYMLNTLPVHLEAWIVALVSAVSLGISLLSTIYPSWRAGKLQPVEALRHD